MYLMERMVEQARANKQRIVLPEGTEERTLQAADRILADNIADIILIGEPAEIMELAQRLHLAHIGKASLVNPSNHPKKEAYTQLLYELRKEKGVTLEKAQKMVEDPLFLGCLMIKNGDADGEVAGARNTTGNVLRSAFQIIKTAPGVKVVSGAFLMFIPDQSYGENGLMVFADCAVLPNPTATELAQIAISTAKIEDPLAGEIGKMPLKLRPFPCTLQSFLRSHHPAVCQEELLVVVSVLLHANTPSRSIIAANPSAAPIVPRFECSPSDASGISSSTTT